MTAWLLVAIVFAVLWLLWRLLNFAFDLIGYGMKEPIE